MSEKLKIKPDAGPLMWHGYACVVEFIEGDREFMCPSCDEAQPKPRKRSRFQCLECGVSLAGFEEGNDPRGTPDYKPPRNKVIEKAVLGVLIEGCPEQFMAVPYKRVDKANILEFLQLDQKLLFEEFGYWAGRYSEGTCAWMSIAHNAVERASRRYATRKRGKGGREDPVAVEDFSEVRQAEDV